MSSSISFLNKFLMIYKGMNTFQSGAPRMPMKASVYLPILQINNIGYTVYAFVSSWKF